MSTNRDRMKKEDRWNVESLFHSWEEWNLLFSLVQRDDSHKGKELQKCKGTFYKGPTYLKRALDLYFSCEETLNRLYTYAHLRLDEDLTFQKSKEGYGRILLLMQEFNQKTSWIEPEILALETPSFYLDSPELIHEQVYLTKIFTRKSHVLEADKEELLALSQQTLQAPSKIFANFNNADLRFNLVEDGKGEQNELTLGTYQLYIRGYDRTLRKNSFESLHGKYKEFENSLAEMLSSHIQTHLFWAKSRKYSSCVEAALFTNQIPVEVYTSLLKCVASRVPSLHRYCEVRRTHLQLDTLNPYDLSVPLVADLDLTFSKDEACEEVIASVAPLGKEYQEILRKGLKEDRWVDFFENKGKRSGAYSSGCHGSYPFILMNFHGGINDLFTLAHEAGHSMHSYLSNRKQSYIYADYPIFVAEVASTFNELLLLDHLLKKRQNPKEKSYLINYQIEGLRGTLFRQTLFAEFELFMHQVVERGEPLTPDLLKEEYQRLHKVYYGNNLEDHPLIALEWARIPHFYSNFYVYQYATGISAAYALHHLIKKDPSKKEGYLQFLSSGSSSYPLDLLQIAGVNMRKEQPIHSAIDAFDEAITSLEKLLNCYPKN